VRLFQLKQSVRTHAHTHLAPPPRGCSLVFVGVFTRCGYNCVEVPSCRRAGYDDVVASDHGSKGARFVYSPSHPILPARYSPHSQLFCSVKYQLSIVYYLCQLSIVYLGVVGVQSDCSGTQITRTCARVDVLSLSHAHSSSLQRFSKKIATAHREMEASPTNFLRSRRW